MLQLRNTPRRRVRSVVKTTRKAMNRALDRAEPRIEDAAVVLDELRRDTAKMIRRQSAEGARQLRQGYDKLQKEGARQLREGYDKLQHRLEGTPARRMHPLRTALIAVGVVTIAIGVLR